MTTLTFPGQVPFDDPSVPAGGCELGLGRCVSPAELEVTVEALASKRRLCREHVGYFMFAVSAEHRAARVLVRPLPALSTAANSSGTHRAR